MTIIEAIKSGKSLGRKNRTFYTHQCHGDNMAARGLFNPAYFLDCVSLTPEDILADDWETEEKKIEISESKFDQIWKEVSDIHNNQIKFGHAYRFFDAVKARLGF